MKAPDKIYMPNELLSEEWCRHIEGQDTEYISKDALMEWAENWEKYKLRTDDGFLYAMELLINKLNSM